MLRIVPIGLCVGFSIAASTWAQPGVTRSDNVTWRFRVQEVDAAIKIGYAVVIADINDDQKPDLVVADTNEVFWYENPSWQRRIVIRNQTKEDNVCIAASDIDGDGQIDLALGAGWPQGFRTNENGTIQWLKRGASLDEPWTVHPIGEEPMVHRLGFVDLDGDGKPHLIVVPLIGRDGTKAGNWSDGRNVRILDYAIPADPVKGPWKPRVLAESLHVVHGFMAVPADRRKGFDLLTASYDGVSRIAPLGSVQEKWGAKLIASGNQDNPTGSRGASEIGIGKLKSGKQFLATIEPWHGNQFVTYSPPDQPDKLWDRNLVDSRLRWGHAIACADLDGDGNDEAIVGVRDDPRSTDSHTDRRGVRIYRFSDESRRWERHLMSDTGAMAVEALTVGDLNGDGRSDIIAVGRQTGNLRIYWNEK
jgi:hypothetical protein